MKHVTTLVWLGAIAAICACDDDPAEAEADAEVPEPGWEVAFDATDSGALLSVWGPAPDDVWAVGGQHELGVAWHYDGAAWTRADIPDGPLLNWVHGASADDVWCVGEGGRILRYRDGSWQAVPSPTEIALWGVWAAGPDDAWAVGGPTAAGTEPQPVLLRWDGQVWNRHALPDAGEREGYRALFKVWGTRADHVFAVGSRGVVLRYDGAEWTAQGSGTGDDLISLWGRADDDIVAVGGRSGGVVARWDGAAWTSEKLPLPGLNGVWMDADGVATLVGLRGRVERLTTGFETETEPTDTLMVLHGVFGLADGTRITVGGSLGESPPWEGVALWKR